MDRIRMACLLGVGLYVSSSMLAQNKPKGEVTTPTTPEAAGQAVFRANCASCHGLDLKGGGPAAPALNSKPTDLTQLSKRNGGKFPLAMVEGAIQGNEFVLAHGTREMPVWGEAFRAVNRDEALVKIKVHNLALYIESMQEK